MHPKAHQIVSVARSFLGTPFLHGHCQKGVGIDCGHLVIAVAQECGISLYGPKGYSKQPNGTLRALCETQGTRVRVPEPGDVLLFAPVKLPQHLAFLTFDNTLIHASERRTQCASKVIEHRWPAKMIPIACYRLPES